MKKLTLIEMLKMINEPYGSACLKISLENKTIFEYAKGSRVKHQVWQGGYMDHITEIMNIAVITYSSLSTYKSLPFSLSDALLILFLHDLEKPWKYSDNQKLVDEFQAFGDYQDFIMFKVTEYSIVLTDDHMNALKYTHGKGDDYDPLIRIQQPLAAFVHCCDTISARIWFDEPKKNLQ